MNRQVDNGTTDAPLFKVQASPELRDALKLALEVIEERHACAYKRDDAQALRTAQGVIATLQLRLLHTIVRARNRALPVIDAPGEAVAKST